MSVRTEEFLCLDCSPFLLNRNLVSKSLTKHGCRSMRTVFRVNASGFRFKTWTSKNQNAYTGYLKIGSSELTISAVISSAVKC
jgi:hypothetical protein